MYQHRQNDLEAQMNDETLRNSDDVDLPGYIDRNDYGYPRLTRYSDKESDTEARIYPPGVTVTGSSNLPIPEVVTEPEKAEERRERRRRRRKKLIPSHVGNGNSLQTSPRQSDEPTSAETQQPGPVKQPPKYLAPIHTKTAVSKATSASLIVPVLPDASIGSKLFVEDEGGGATAYFQDGVRSIDYVMAYKVDEEQDSTKHDEMRKSFEEKLEEKGLELEREGIKKSQDQKTCFVKLHVPWETRLRYAERMKMKMPLKEGKVEEVESHEDEEMCDCNAFKRCVRKCRLHNTEIKEKFTEPECYTSEFMRDKMEFFQFKDEDTFFSHADRARMAHRIMCETRHGEKDVGIGIDQLVIKGVYDAAYPLHDGSFEGDGKKASTEDSMRRILYWEWARWGRWYKFQPLDLIRQYLGDKIAIYFAWLGFYTKMLMYPTFVGFVVFIYSIATLWTYPPTREICDETYDTYAGNLTMCPLCDQQCTYWKLKTSCLAARITYVFDNESTIFFAVFMSVWATMFLELWKRRQFELAYDWDLVNYDEERDLIRPEFEARVTTKRLNHITGQSEPFLEQRDQYSRAALSLSTVLFWLCVIIGAAVALIIYRLAVNSLLSANLDLSSLGAIGEFATPSMVTTITASLLSLIIIMLLNKVYEKVAIWLTDMELPRTQIEFEDSFTWKMFCFQFVNYYSTLFYIAFFKNPIAGHPDDYTYFGEWRWSECDVGGCMYELSLQLIIIMLGKQLWNNLWELVWPWLKNKYRQWQSRKTSKKMPENEYTRWEQDYDLNATGQMDLFYEYLEMVIQFGFVTLFVSAFPLAPVLALINNIIEIRLDANKFICEYRRPLAHKCSDIGVWYHLLEFIGSLAVVTNAFIIAITSDTIPKMVYLYVYSLSKYPYQTLQGYTDDSLSIFNVSDFAQRDLPNNLNPFPGEVVTECRYRDYRSPPGTDGCIPEYTHTVQYWHVIAARLAFIIAMEHVVYFLKRFLDYIIPDRPKRLKEKIKREHFLVQDMMFSAEKEQLHTSYKLSDINYKDFHGS